MRIYEIDGMLVNSDNSEEWEILEGNGGVEVPLSAIEGNLEHIKWLSSDNTHKIGGVWVFSPDLDEIQTNEELTEESELRASLEELVGPNPQDQIDMLQSFSLQRRPTPVADRLLAKMKTERGNILKKLQKLV